MEAFGGIYSRADSQGWGVSDENDTFSKAEMSG